MIVGFPGVNSSGDNHSGMYMEKGTHVKRCLFFEAKTCTSSLPDTAVAVSEGHQSIDI